MSTPSKFPAANAAADDADDAGLREPLLAQPQPPTSPALPRADHSSRTFHDMFGDGATVDALWASSGLEPTPEDTSGWFAKLTFLWMGRMMTVGSKRPLQMDDIPQISRRNMAELQRRRFAAHWADENAKAAAKAAAKGRVVSKALPTPPSPFPVPPSLSCVRACVLAGLVLTSLLL